jgi:hypothetical protein
MAMRERNYVHFALMGRDDIAMDILKAVNGVADDCKIVFHGNTKQLHDRYLEDLICLQMEGQISRFTALISVWK